MSSRTAGPPDQRSRRREEVLAGLRELFLREGFRHLSVGDLAERLSCSRSTLYLVAPTKEQVVVAAVRSWFRGAADRVEAAVAEADDPADRLQRYLRAVSAELGPATPRFYADLAAFPPAGEVYRHNTEAAARRVAELVEEGVRRGVLRPVHARFVGAAVATLMSAIQRGELGEQTGLNDAEAYEHLADLVAQGLTHTGE